jgi:hypothetical protein
VDKTWANLKNYFAIEAKEYYKRHSGMARETYQVANVTNQALLEAQADFRNYTISFIEEFQQALSNPKGNPNDK